MVFVKKLFLWAMLLALCLTACSQSPQSAATPSPALSPSPTAAAPSPTPTSSPALSPSEELKELWGFPIDDTHDAFEVDTGGKLGTVLVTVDSCEMEDREPEWLPLQMTIRVWEQPDSSQPLQTLEINGTLFDPEARDINFDGHPDIDYVWSRSATNMSHSLLVWDEDEGQFVHKGDFLGYGLITDDETQTLHEYTHGSAVAGIHSIYRWEAGELVCARTVNVNMDGWDLVICDRIDGELTEVHRETFGPPDPELEGDNPIYEEVPKWYDLSYLG